jgi:hypothetical protein
VADPRSPLGRRYSLPSLLALAVCAMTPAGNDSLTAAAEWCQRASPEELAAFALPYDVLRGRFRIPSEKTLRRVLGLLDPAEVSAAGFACLKPVLEQITAPSAERTPDGLIEREQRRAHRRAAKALASTPKRQAYAVDGKCLRGARRPDGSRVFVLSTVRHGDGITLASREIGAKTNEVRHEALCRIPNSVRRNSEERSWARWLTRIRKVMGTGACHENRRSCPDARNGAPGDPRDMAKALLPEPQSPVMQVFIHRKQRLKPVPRPAFVYFVGGGNFRDVGRCPVRVLKGMSGAPKLRYDVRQRRTWDRLRGASPMATECS